MSHLSHGRGIFHEEVPVVDELFCQLMVNAVEDSITKVCHVALATSDTSKVITRQNNTKYTKCHRQSYELSENHPNSSNKSATWLRGSTLNNQNSKAVYLTNCTKMPSSQSRACPKASGSSPCHYGTNSRGHGPRKWS